MMEGDGGGGLSMRKMFLRMAPFFMTVKTGIFLSSVLFSAILGLDFSSFLKCKKENKVENG